MPDIVIIPNRQHAATGIPTIYFSGASGNSIRLEVQSDGSLAFMGNNGQLFGITDSLTGSLMNVSDIAGLPILEVFSDDRVVAGAYNTNTFVVSGVRVGIGTGDPRTSLHVTGVIRADGGFYSGATNIVDLLGLGAIVYKTGNQIITGIKSFINSVIVGNGVVNPAATPPFNMTVTGTAGPYGAPAYGGINGDRYVYTHVGPGDPSIIWRNNGDFRFGTETSIGAGYSEKARLTTNGRLGIGITTPQAILHVSGGGTILGGSTTDTDLWIGQPNGAKPTTNLLRFYGMDRNFDISFNTSQAKLQSSFGEIMLLPATNIGLGISGAAERVHISGGNLRVESGNIYAGTQSQPFSQAIDIQKLAGTQTALKLFQATVASMFIGSKAGDNNAYWSNTYNTDVDFGAAHRSITLKTNGAVGIGTINPGAYLNTTGNFRIDASGNSLILGVDQRTTRMVGAANGGAVEIRSDSATTARWLRLGGIDNNGTFSARMTFMNPASSNAVGIGTDGPIRHLDISGNTTNMGLVSNGGATRIVMGNTDSAALPSIIMAANGETYIGVGTSYGSSDGGTMSYAAKFGSDTVIYSGASTPLSSGIQGNFGQHAPHATYVDLNTVPAQWGWSYVQGNANGPHKTSAQWYRERLSLGKQYSIGTSSESYWLEIAVPRYGQRSLFTRVTEAGVTSGWQEVGSNQTSRTLVASTTLTANEPTVIYCNNTSTITVTVPAATAVSGRLYTLKLQNTGVVIVTGVFSSTFDGQPSLIMATPYQAQKIHSDGLNYFLI